MSIAVYKIQCQSTGKTYIGSTCDVKRRWRHHITDAFNPKSISYNRPLQRDIRKFGREDFIFEIIENFESNLEGTKAEQKLILELNTLFPSGYNLLDGLKIAPSQKEGASEKIRKTKRAKYGKKVAQIDPQTREIIQLYNSLAEAEEKIEGVSRFKISLVANGRRKTHLGLIFRFVDEKGDIIEVEYEREYSKGDTKISNKKQYKRTGVEIEALDPKTLEVVLEFCSYAAAARYFNIECSQTIKQKCDNFFRRREKSLYRNFLWKRKGELE